MAEEALLLHEPPVRVKVLRHGKEVSVVQLPDGSKHNISNTSLSFDLDEEETEEAVEVPEKKAKTVTGRHGKVAVTVNGHHYDSVRRAFNELALPLREKSRVRRSLRSTGTATVKFADVEYVFTRVGKDDD
jgi:hypothetical protein